MNTSSPHVNSLTEGIQLLRLADKMAASMMTPPPSDSTCESQKSQKSTSNHSDHENSKLQQDRNAYIESLKEEREQLTQCSDSFNHAFTLLDKEIKRVAGGDQGEETAGGGMLSEIIMVPVEQYPTYNFVGRILGPRGTTAKQLEATTGCRVTILGRVKKDDPSTPPIDNGPLRVQISVPADAPEAARRMETGTSLIKALLIPPADGQDELKRQQLMVLANMNGTYRPRTTATSPVRFSAAGDYGHQFQNLLPYGYRLPVKSQSQHDSKLDCFNPKCAILRGLIDQNNNNNNNSIPKVEDVLNVMHMYELMNRIRLANSSLYGRQEDMSKAQEIGNRMCSSIGVPRPAASTAPAAAPATRRLYNVKTRQASNPAK
ncbi:hypothetical protein CAEBREN_23632 [Caenorhabditis brenneri]|uniref:K Homology domain-containing protein n=1 Tax=Caenorhabditis brenneri TaxID=135651 RepID=G0P4V2_CAEBE|nr:hypothetical protein CAEBREN_23632 [Caenorhabditis brenneri]